MALKQFIGGERLLASDLNSMVDAIQIIETTWSNLKTLRDNSQLIQGATYRITDYTCTTVQEGTQSAGHVFDILVTADDVNVLNENAHAIQHSGDTYFQNSDLSAWELKYCLDNDTTRFAWADNSSAGRGVIYYMKDEYNNECPYDFKNIQYKRYKITSCSKSPDLVDKYSINGAQDITVDTETPYYCYTFSVIDNNNGVIDDVSVIQNKYIGDEGYCYKTNGNVIKGYYNTNEDCTKQYLKLSNNVFVTDTDIISASFDESDNITYSDFYGYYSNTFGNNCQNNTFGNDCYRNTFGNSCHNNTFGNNCYNNTFGNNCYNNTFGNSCGSNTFGNDCGSNTFGNDCTDNTFGNYCYNNTFGNNCGSNTFGNDCYSNTFGNGCYYNTFGNNCYRNTFGNSCRYNTFGNSCNNNTLGNDYIYYCTFFEGVQYLNVSITTTDTNYLQYMQVLNGTKGTSSNKLQITGSTYVTAGRAYTTTIGKNSSGTLTSKVPMDA